eukprot:CAMPEP_0174373472 /NCGR_PEP_ID=MMETSP0811_2-20130205/107178_1 /TAXON_ID=73025 ORGANISM="Eutreptiella gymnastica-like, Strain CCMP1594" /NCGR_SAMPLE_ID=MMETSP0811_2 /ASSEMBLY_ACC=CAM_ASM_000667 /LENGTH=103 /DNA_ID=CAMNT_0015521813 /DNA_START=239 /DNA_END=550 /DNA_ORIENTATION=+
MPPIKANQCHKQMVMGERPHRHRHTHPPGYLASYSAKMGQVAARRVATVHMSHTCGACTLREQRHGETTLCPAVVCRFHSHAAGGDFQCALLQRQAQETMAPR